MPSGEPSRALTAAAPATAEAALPPCPAERGSPFVTVRAMPPAGVVVPNAVAARMTAMAASPEAWRAISSGSSGSPASRMTTPGTSFHSAVTESPAPVTAAPSTSSPGPTFPILPGA
jgi:hypothetical protein